MGVVGAVAAAATVVAACAPDALIRRTALIPGANAPARSGYALERGEVRLEGHMNALRAGGQADVGERFTEVGDPGVFIPDLHLGGSVYFGLPVGLEIGAQGYYASGRWARKNTSGVLPFPEDDVPDLFMAGPGVRYNMPLRNPRVNLAVLSEFNIVTVPEAIFVCTDRSRCDGDAAISLGEAQSIYALERVERETFVLPHFGFQGGYLVHDHVHVYGMLGAQTSVTNIGFDNDLSRLGDHTMETFWMGYAGLGVDVRYGGFVVGGSFYMPFESVERIDFGPSFSFKIGGVFGGRAPTPQAAPMDEYGYVEPAGVRTRGARYDTYEAYDPVARPSEDDLDRRPPDGWR